MIAALLLGAASPVSALEAERAYARAIRIDGRRVAARSFGPALGWDAACADSAAVAKRPLREFASFNRTCEQWRTMVDRDSRAERRPALIFHSCEANGPVVISGTLVDEGKPVGTFRTAWLKSATGWQWNTDHYSTTASVRPLKAKPRSMTPDCGRHSTFDQQLKLLKPDVDLLLSNLVAAQIGEHVDWLATQRRLVAADVIFTTGNGEFKRGLPRKLPNYDVVGNLPSGESKDASLQWDGWLIAGIASAYNFAIKQWCGVKKGWQTVYYELNGVSLR